MKPLVPVPLCAKVRLLVRVREGAYHGGVDCATVNCTISMGPINRFPNSKLANRIMAGDQGI